ncbi:MAG: Holliday junction resolvase RuvX [Dongiaceae bacterium]
MKKRLLGLDIGTKTIGIAVSDSRGKLASPVTTIHRQKLAKDIEALEKLIAEYKAEGLVLGLPLNMDGSEGPRCQSVRQFAKNIEPRIALPMVFWDERLSTSAVEREMIAADVSRAKRDKAIDKLAAAYILQGYLDAQHDN